jgi:transposase
VQRLQLEYRWRYLLLAVAPLTGALRWAWIDRMRQADLVPILQEWAPTCLVWDGAPSHRGKAVAALPWPRVPLPAYAPELNPAERIFEEIRARIEGVVYESLEAKQAVADAYLHELQRDPARVKRLCGWAWLTTALRALSPAAP